MSSNTSSCKSSSSDVIVPLREENNNNKESSSSDVVVPLREESNNIKESSSSDVVVPSREESNNIKESRSSDVVGPVREESNNNEGTTKIRRWSKKLLDLEEAKNQILFSLPLILTNLSIYLITLISVMFAGHLGQIELAGATLAGSWATVTGFAFMTGLSGALETLCGQSFGAKLYKTMGIYLQAACIISFLSCVLISVIWLYTEPILILLQQDPKIAATAAQYMKFLIPGLFAYGFLQQILRFLQAQSVVVPQIMFSFIPMCTHIGIVYVLVHFTPLAFKGAPLATSISLWIPVFMLVVYIMYSKNFKHTWAGFSSESFLYIGRELKLALPSAAMVCLEYWAFEILVFVAGLMTNPQLATSLIAMCANTESVAYMLTYGLSAAASTRVSNELGAGNPDKAKHAMAVTVKLSVLLAVGVVLALAFGHNIWAGFFSDSTSIIKQFASLSPFLAISITLDSIQGVLSGVARGCGWQHLAMYVNFGTFYLIGLPIACVLGFKLNLYVKGLWIGLNCGLCCQAATLLLITLRTKWAAIDLSAERDKEEGVIVV